ncbi:MULTISPECIES: hypothetical protein [unclassified Clostridium]|uniref:hypothetical protein n=1 Tax=unclassified Clostridium TaxID=2614128 RepID=UPI0018977B6B|nr:MULTISPECIES: hypothetical protein [unclassified Clostridium]MCR1952769.1 hypothetical protein [Clostridium sp. DSM 100503]
MFLKELNKEESIAFINLVSIFADVDNKFAKEEKVLLKEYKEELGLSDSEVHHMGYDEVLEIIRKSNDRAKAIVYFELVGLALVDGEYEDEEVDFLENLASVLSISRSKKIAIANYFYNFKEVYNFTTVDADNNIELLKEQAESILK